MTELELLGRPERWPCRVLLPLAHRTRVDDWGSPLCAVLALGHSLRVYFANVGDFEREELRNRVGFEVALTRFQSVSYISAPALLAEWRID